MLAVALTLLAWQRFDRAPLQPYEVRSASGEWTLEVRPSDPRGTGAMHARILHGAEVSWAGDFPFTFEKAGVSDDGTCVGYSNAAKLRIAVLDAKGAPRKQHELARGPGVMHGPDLPFASGPVLVHPAADVALIRVQTEKESRPVPWRAFRLSTGEELAQVVPELPLEIGEHEGLYAGDAQAIGATGLALVSWWYADYDAADVDWSQDGAVFALHDVAGKVVWRLGLLDDYTDRTSEKADDALEHEARRTGAIVSVGPGARFVLHHFREGARVEYAVERTGDAWNVKAVAREPWSEPAASVAPVAEPIELVKTSAVALRAPSSGAQHPVHGIATLSFTEQGEIELLRREDGNGVSYARLRTDGELVFERELSASLPGTDGLRQYHDLSGDRWLVQFVGGDPPWIVLDVRTGETSTAPLPDGMISCHVAPLADGGYLALVPQIVRSLAFTELFFVQADGTLGWRQTVEGIGPDETDFDRAVYFGQGIARTGERTFVLLGMDELTRVDLDRNVLESWDLTEVLGRDAGYLNGVLSDGKVGVLFRSGDAFQRVDAFGTHTGSFVPKRADGSRDPIMDHLLCTAPDGRVWTSDRQRVYRLDDVGVADLVLGPEPKDDVLAEVSSGAIDVLGRALLQDAATRSVFVFDADGRRVGLCRLEPAERPEGYQRSPFGGEPDGTVWVAIRGGKAYFDPSGQRHERSREEQREDANRGSRDEVRTRPDGQWLAKVIERAFLADGRQVLLEAPAEKGAPAALHFYEASGAPLETVAIPTGAGHSQLSVGAHWIVVGDYGPRWTLVRLAEQRVFRFDSGLPDAGNWRPGQTPDGKTLLLLNVRAAELVGYELP